MKTRLRTLYNRLRALWRIATARWRAAAPAPVTAPALEQPEPSAMDLEPEPLDPAIQAEIEAAQRDIADKATQAAALETQLAETQGQLSWYVQCGALSAALDQYRFTSPEARRIAREALESRITPDADVAVLARDFLRENSFLLAPVVSPGSGACNTVSIKTADVKNRLFAGNY